MKNIGKGIYLRGNVYWLAFQINRKRYFVSLETDNPQEALKRALMVRKSDVTQPSLGLNAEVEQFIESKKRLDRYSPRTQGWARDTLRQFINHVGPAKSAKEISKENVEAFYHSVRSRVSENTAHSYHRAIKSFFAWCVQNKLCYGNPCSEIKLGKQTEPARLRFASKEQRDQILHSAPDEDMQFIFYCAFHAGMRFNEIVEARPGWFDLAGGYVTIEETDTFRPKNRKTRSVPLTTPFREFLTFYGLRDPYMLRPDVGYGVYRYRYDFSRPWRLHVRNHGLAWITPHTARHTFASLLVQNGESIYKVAKWLGDTLEVTERHYAHLVKDDRSIDRLI